MAQSLYPQSEALLARARRVLPGGVNSPVRAFRGVGGTPLFITAGDGSRITDADGRQYIDYVGSWGPLIFGHNFPPVREAIHRAVDLGVGYGAPTELEVALAEWMVDNLSAVEMVRLVCSGTEATMTALRIARGATGREKIIKFNGCYHGHSDALLVQAGSGVLTCGVSGSAGVSEMTAASTLSIEFNDAQLLDQTIDAAGADKIAAIIVEPVPGNMGLILPEPAFLHHLREVCSKHGIVLIFDEVMSGFRVAFGGAVERFGVEPDLLTYGKVIGGGLPVGAVAGRQTLMELLAPVGPVYQAGTLAGNPVAVSAGLAALQCLKELNPYPEFERRAERWASGVSAAAQQAGVPCVAYHCGSMLGIFLCEGPIRGYQDLQRGNLEMFKKLFHALLRRGVYIAPSAFEAGFLSAAHSDDDIEETIAAFRSAFVEILD